MERTSFSERIPALGIIVLLAVSAFFVGFAVGSESSEVNRVSGLVNKEEGKPRGVDFSPFWKAWNRLDEKHIHGSTINDQDKVWAAIQGLTRAYNDPNTVFMTPSETEMFESDISGEFEGVGMEIGKRDEALTVIAPLKGTPAERAGVQAGDRIIEIDNVETRNMNVNTAVRMIRGERGTEVVITVMREGDSGPREISITRDVIQIPTIETYLRDDGIFVIELYNFAGQAVSLFEEALGEFEDSGSDKLILDLRGNPGGFLNASIEIASYFLPQGEVVVRERFSDGRDEKAYRSRGYGVFPDGKEMVVLINQGSASASEILAGALAEHGVATTVGAQTFGKGSVQELVPVTRETSLKVTIAEWLTPDGHSFEGEGIVPEHEVEMSFEDHEAGRDPQRDRAVELLMGR